MGSLSHLKRGRAGGLGEGAGREEGPGGEAKGGGLGTGVGAAPRSRGLRSNGVGAVLPGCWSRGAGARVCQRDVRSRPADAWSPRQGERPCSPGTRLGRSWGRGVGLVRKVEIPELGRPVKEPLGAGSTVTGAPGAPGSLRPCLEGPLSGLKLGRRGSESGVVDSRNRVSAAEGRERGVSCADADFGALGEWGWSSTGSFQLKGWEDIGDFR